MVSAEGAFRTPKDAAKTRAPRAARVTKDKAPQTPQVDFNSAATFAPAGMELSPRQKEWYVYVGNFYFDNAVAFAPVKRPIKKDSLSRDTALGDAIDTEDWPAMKRRLRQTFGRVLSDEESKGVDTLGAAMDVTVRMAVESDKEVPEERFTPPAKGPVKK